MQNNKKLFELIQSLSKSEKIYLKKFAFLHDRNKKNNYLELFNILQKQRTYDDDKLAEALKKKSISKNLSSIKHYLYKLILRSLRNYHHGDNTSMEVKNLIADIHILYQRGLYNQCRSLISSTKKIVLKYEMYSEYYILLKSEINLVIAIQGDANEMKEIVKEQKRVLAILANSLTYQELSNETYFYTALSEQTAALDQKKVQELFRHPFLTDIKHAQTFYDKSNFYFSNGRKRYLLADDKADDYLIKNMELWESKPHFIKDNVSDYLVLLHNIMLLNAHNVKKAGFMSELINKLKSISSNSLHIQAKLFQFAYMTQQDQSTYFGTFEEEKKSIPYIEKELKKYDAVTPYNMKLVFYFNTAYVLFGCGDYKAALLWINKALDIESKTTSKLYIMILKIIKLFVFLELKNFELLEFSLRSVTRTQRKSFPKGLSLMLDFIRKYPSANSDKQLMHQLLQITIQKLNEIIKDPAEKQIIEAFDFLSLIESKFTGQSFARIVQGKVQNKIRGKDLV
ncbi:MAG: hypothetical protein HYU69_03250 [Bacteroidetes bacterium]|nr:hypothetical protein [Bacteroidota bacterium]